MKHIKKFGAVNEQNQQEEENLYELVGRIRRDFDYVEDGVYDITDIDFLNISGLYRNRRNNAEVVMQQINDFIGKYPDSVLAEALETEYLILLSEMPTKKFPYIGSGFNHGSTNIIDNCPKRILILGEDD